MACSHMRQRQECDAGVVSLKGHAAMSKNAKNTAATTTSTQDEATQAALISAMVKQHADAIRLGIALREERDQRAGFAQRLMADASWAVKLDTIVAFLDEHVFADCLDVRQAEAHRIAVNLREALVRASCAEAGSREMADAVVDVQALVALLVQRGPSSVRQNPELTAALQGYRAIFSGMRSVPLDISHTTSADKLAAIRAAEDKRRQRNLDALAALKNAVAAPVVDADK